MDKFYPLIEHYEESAGVLGGNGRDRIPESAS
jgi:hypothetical protein